MGRFAESGEGFGLIRAKGEARKGAAPAGRGGFDLLAVRAHPFLTRLLNHLALCGGIPWF